MNDLGILFKHMSDSVNPEYSLKLHISNSNPVGPQKITGYPGSQYFTGVWYINIILFYFM